MNLISRWDTLPLKPDTRAWFVTDMNLRHQCAPEGRISLIVEMPKMRCHWINFLFEKRDKWLHNAIKQTAVLHRTPELLITDNRALYPEVVSASAGLRPPATAILDIPITAVAELGDLIRSLETPLNTSRFKTAKDLNEINAVLQGWLEEHALQSVRGRLL